MTYELLLTHAAIQALGWSLLHFFWQGTLLTMLLWTVNAIAGKSTTSPSAARIRYAAACVVMLLMVVALLATLISNYPSQSPTYIATSRPDRGPGILPSGTPLPYLAVVSPGIGLTGWVVSIWFAGVVILSGRMAGGWLRAQIIKRRSCDPVSPELIRAFENLKQRLRVTGPVRLCASVKTKTPMVIGWIRPLVRLPATALTGLNELQLRSVLAHELAHIRRHDYLINLLQTAVETIFFYHPAVWWVGRQMRIERENCCDDMAVEVCGDATEYARALAQLEELRLAPSEPAIAASGGELLGRIRRLLEHERTTYRAPRSLGAIAGVIFVLSIAVTPVMWSLSAAPQQQLEEQAQRESARAEIPQQPAPAPVPAPAFRTPPSPAQTPPIDRVPGNGLGNGVGNGLGVGVGNGLDEFRVNADAVRSVLLEARRSLASFRVPFATSAGPSTQSTELLIKLYDSTQDVEVKRHILDYLGSSKTPEASQKVLSVARSDASPELRRHAIDYIGIKSDPASLIALYDESREKELKRHILDYIGSSSSPQAAQKLLSVARSYSEPELRRHAIDYLGSKPDAFDTLVDLFDNTREPELKRHVLDYLGSSNDPRALQKLFSIAQSDPDRNMRRAAVDYIAGR
jgi:beta-lactamase regulating signal transducer with metallopeptidase domain